MEMYEFSAVLKHATESGKIKDDLAKNCDELDKNGDGLLTREEMEPFVAQFREEAQQRGYTAVCDLFARMDTNGDG